MEEMHGYVMDHAYKNGKYDKWKYPLYEPKNHGLPPLSYFQKLL